MGRKRSSPAPYAGADYSGTNYDVTKDFESQFGRSAPTGGGMMRGYFKNI